MIRPWLLRPPVFGFGDTRDFSGVVRVTSTKSATLEPRRPGVVGLYLRIPMTCVRPYSSGLSEQVDAVAVGHGHDGALRVRAAPRPVARPTLLANTINRVGKKRRTRYGTGRRPDTKRAIVTVADGDRIDLFAQA